MDWGAVSGRGVKPLAIVISLYPVNDIQASLGSRFVTCLVDALDLQGLKEALHRCIVPGIGTPTHRHRHAEGRGQLPVSPAGILDGFNRSLQH